MCFKEFSKYYFSLIFKIFKRATKFKKFFKLMNEAGDFEVIEFLPRNVFCSLQN